MTDRENNVTITVNNSVTTPIAASTHVDVRTRIANLSFSGLTIGEFVILITKQSLLVT